MQITTHSMTIPLRNVQPLPQPGSAGTTAVNCTSCHLKELCLPAGLRHDDVERLDALRFGRRRVKQGESLYRERDKFQFVYAVRSGTFKSSVTLTDGREQVTGFSMAGELLGLDGMAHGHHHTAAHALEDAEVCSIPYAHLSALASENRSMQALVARLMGREIVRDQSLLVMLGSMNAEERVAAFLLNISKRMKARGYSANEFNLRMDRCDIGSYLGMKLETVSRTLSGLQAQGLVEVDKKHIRIADLDGLARSMEKRLH
jgi:CRP/FNR family transcriptional regulator, anaerobic regulatory protein